MSQNPISIEDLHQLSDEAWTAFLNSLYEHSPWVVEEATKWRPYASKKALQARLESIIYGADSDRQEQLISSHPDLAAKMDELAALTDFSQAEQARAGFSALPKEIFDTLRDTLGLYRERFGHPFILCVSEHSASDTLPILAERIKASPQSEKIACLAQVSRIGWHRLTQLVSD